jgi:F0F1-type ATP synthase assembly protein I
MRALARRATLDAAALAALVSAVLLGAALGVLLVQYWPS